MGEVLRNVLLLTWMACAVNNVQAAENQVTIEEEAPVESTQPTVVFGAAQKKGGGENEALIEQNPNGGNPLGNPLVVEPQPTGVSAAKDLNDVSQNRQVHSPTNTEAEKSGIKPIEQSSEQGELKPWQEPLPQPSDKIENELYQSGNDIIDVQAYPIKDVSTVTEPNLQPRIITQ